MGEFLARMPLLFDGIRISNAQSVEITHEVNAQEVATIDKGLAGKSPGVGRTRITGRYAVEVGGDEYDFWNNAVDGTYVTAQVGMGDKDYVALGWFTSVGKSVATDKALEGSFEWVGPPAKAE